MSTPVFAFGIEDIGGENETAVALAVGLLKLGLALEGGLELIALNRFIIRGTPFLGTTKSAFSRDRNQSDLGEGVIFEDILENSVFHCHDRLDRDRSSRPTGQSPSPQSLQCSSACRSPQYSAATCISCSDILHFLDRKHPLTCDRPS